jgi:hypothetical protein
MGVKPSGSWSGLATQVFPAPPDNDDVQPLPLLRDVHVLQDFAGSEAASGRTARGERQFGELLCVVRVATGCSSSPSTHEMIDSRETVRGPTMRFPEYDACHKGFAFHPVRLAAM